MTCYFRHLKDAFEKAGIKVTNENKRKIDKVIHEIVGVEYKHCPEVWREVKKRLVSDKDGFVLELKEALGKKI